MFQVILRWSFELSFAGSHIESDALQKKSYINLIKHVEKWPKLRKVIKEVALNDDKCDFHWSE